MGVDPGTGSGSRVRLEFVPFLQGGGLSRSSRRHNPRRLRRPHVFSNETVSATTSFPAFLGNEPIVISMRPDPEPNKAL
jgi:hypothetical protein